MDSKRLGIYGFLSAAAIVSGVLVGCGGSSASVQGASPVVSATGGITNTAGAGTAGTSSGSSPQQVQVTINGNTVTGTLPANETIPASGTVATIPPGTPIIQGLTLGPKFHGQKGAPTVSHGVQGEVDVDGCDTGLTVQSDGSLSGYLFLVPGNHVIHAQGPFAIINGINQLTVGQFNFGVTVLADGNASIPSALSMRLPSNGGSLANGNFVHVTYPVPDFATGNGTLTLSYSGINVVKTQTVVNGTATYNQITSKPSSTIPAGGVDNVTFNYAP